ncbi:CDP-6-deoxy-L-threo-D-glycero-4-hexulose-3-dehydrase reductase [gamma proteobacterium HTCC5015]|nr:CDP-6-deoxy-L-threo-D-glycero-4-hexulose-3-dehydrase reductase [gamma proteobacterium HTCC5015]
MSHTITIQPSGHQFECDSSQSVLEAALQSGFAVPYGCRNGACGACMGRIVSGQVEYPNDVYVGMTLQGESDDKALLCQARACSDLELEVREIGAAKDIQIKTLPVRVHRAERLADDVIRLFLKLPATQRLPFLAGQYIDFLLKNGQRRSFSLANAPHDDALLELHIRRVDEGFFTGFVFERLKEKDLLRIEGPHGSFHLNEESDKPLILMAGGTGFAPIKSLIEHMIHTDDHRPVHLFWGVRNQPDLYLNHLAELWQKKHHQIQYTPVLSEAAADREWTGERGWVHDSVIRHYADLSDHEVYCCGPPPMIEAAKHALKQQGLNEEAFHFDSFEFNH